APVEERVRTQYTAEKHHCSNREQEAERRAQQREHTSPLRIVVRRPARTGVMRAGVRVASGSARVAPSRSAHVVASMNVGVAASGSVGVVAPGGVLIISLNASAVRIRGLPRW